MARSHARVLTSIWADGDFCARSPRAREMYLFLISQPDLEHSGVIGVRTERWADDLAGTEPDDLRAAMEELAEHRFIVIDWRKQEVLVRSLIRRDDVWRQPNVFKSAATSIRAVRSPAIKAALLAELIRLDLTSANKDVITLRDELADELTHAIANPSGNPSLTLPDGSAEPLAEGMPPAQGKGNSNGEVPLASPSPSPATIPLPLSPAIPPPAGAASPRAAEPGGKQDDSASKRKSRQPSANAGDVIAAYVEGAEDAGLPTPSTSLKARVGRQGRELLAEGKPLDSLVIAARHMGASGWDDLARQVQRDAANVKGAGANGSRPSTTDQRVAQAQALKAELNDDGDTAGQLPSGTIQGSVIA